MWFPPFGIDPDTHPSEPQEHFMQSAAEVTYTYMVGGLGSGKSWVGAWAFLLNILENREALNEDGRAPELIYLVGAPTYQLIDAGPWRHILTLLDEIAIINGYSLVKGKPLKTHPREIRLTTGDVIKFISTDSGRFAGINASGAWLDEAEEAGDIDGSFHLLDNRLRDQASPRLFYLVTSTPGVAGQGVARIFKDRIAQGDDRYALIHAKTDSNPAFADGDYVSRRRATMSAREARVKLDGEILPPEGAIFGLEYDDVLSIDHHWEFKRGSGKEIWLYADWGGSYHALLGVYDPATDTDTIFDEVTADGVQDREFCQMMLDMCRKWGIKAQDVTGVVCDYNPKDARMTAYKFWPGRVRHRRVRDNNDRKSRINTVRWRLLDAGGSRRLKFARRLRESETDRPVLMCLQNYKNQERRVQGEMVELDRPIQDSKWSHACDALGYGMWVRHSHKRFHDESRAV